jgi:hypothetical protein
LRSQRRECDEGDDRDARGGGKKKTFHADMIVDREATDEQEIRRPGRRTNRRSGGQGDGRTGDQEARRIAGWHA